MSHVRPTMCVDCQERIIGYHQGQTRICSSCRLYPGWRYEIQVQLQLGQKSLDNRNRRVRDLEQRIERTKRIMMHARLAEAQRERTNKMFAELGQVRG